MGHNGHIKVKKTQENKLAQKKVYFQLLMVTAPLKLPEKKSINLLAKIVFAFVELVSY